MSEDRRLIFLANPKTASTSLARALQELREGPFVLQGTHHSDEWSRQQKRFRTFKTFCVIRNPFDAVVSWCASQPDTDLPQMPALTIARIQRALPPNYVSEHRLFPHVAASDIVVSYENLLPSLMRLLGDPVKLPEENVSKWRRDEHYRHFYNDRTFGYVYGRFEEEIERFHYEF